MCAPNPRVAVLLVNRWCVAFTFMVLCTLTLTPMKGFANSIVKFSISGTFNNGYSFTPGSSLTIDTTTGFATDAFIHIQCLACGLADVGNSWVGMAAFTINTPALFTLQGSPNATALLYFYGNPSFVDFSGGPLAMVDFICSGCITGGSTISSSTVLTSLSVPVPAPEPPTLLLLATGLAIALGTKFWLLR